MAISRIGTATAGTASLATSISVTISGTGRQAGDLMIGVHATGFTTTVAPVTPSGWTQLGTCYCDSTNVSNLSVYWKISDGTETSVTFTTASAASTTHSGVVVVYRGTYAGAPSGANFPNQTNAASNGTVVGPTQTSVPTGAVVVSIGTVHFTATLSCTVSGTNWTEIVDFVNTNSRFRCIDYAENVTSTGSVTGATHTFTSSDTRNNAVSFHILPASLAVYPLLMSM